MFRVVPVEHAQKIDIPVLLMHSEFEKKGGCLQNQYDFQNIVLFPYFIAHYGSSSCTFISLSLLEVATKVGPVR